MPHQHHHLKLNRCDLRSLRAKPSVAGRRRYPQQSVNEKIGEAIKMKQTSLKITTRNKTNQPLSVAHLCSLQLKKWFIPQIAPAGGRSRPLALSGRRFTRFLLLAAAFAFFLSTWHPAHRAA